MRKALSILLLSASLVSGCGSDREEFVFRADGPAAPVLRTVIPSAGGQVTLPSVDGIAGHLLFEPGVSPGTEMTLSASSQPPAQLQLPLVGLDSPHATTEHYYFVTLTVNRPTPLSLLEGVRLEGDLPLGHEHYHADLYQVSEVRGQGSNGTLLQEFPGEHDGPGATFDEILDHHTLEPGVSYVMGFKSTDQQLLTFKVINNSGITPCYVTIKGQNPNPAANDRRFYYVNREGELVPMSLKDLDSQGFADYNIEVPESGEIKLPLALSGRLYISLGAKLKTQLFTPTLPSDPPALWVAPDGWSNPNEPNFLTLWDFVEFDYKISPDSNLPGMGVNTTQVQMTAIPTTLTLVGPTHGSRSSGAKGDGTRSALVEGLRADPDFQSLILDRTATNTDVSPLRVISADNGILNARRNIPGVPRFSETYYDEYIDQVWDKYRSEDLEMVTSAFGTFLGRVNERDEMIFRQPGKRSVVVPKPGTTDVIVGDGLLLADLPNATTDEERAVVGEIASTMSACFNRTTLLVFPKLIRNPFPRDAYDPSIFYQNNPTNLYSKLNHALSLPTEQAPEGGAYGFGFDDNLDRSSVLIDNRAPTELTVTIPKF